jgi:hypothetical protein
MDINDLFDGIMKSINQYADLSACLPARGAQAGDAQAGEITEQRLQEKACLRQAWRGRQVQQTGRGPENGGKNAENFGSKEKRGMTDFPKRE